MAAFSYRNRTGIGELAVLIRKVTYSYWPEFEKNYILTHIGETGAK